MPGVGDQKLASPLPHPPFPFLSSTPPLSGRGGERGGEGAPGGEVEGLGNQRPANPEGRGGGRRAQKPTNPPPPQDGALALERVHQNPPPPFRPSPLKKGTDERRGLGQVG